MHPPRPKRIASFVGIVALSALAYGLWQRLQQEGGPEAAPLGAHAAPVEVAPVEHGELALRRSFSGALEATAEFVVASKVGGRIEEVRVDLSDPVRRGDVVVVLDDDEPVQARRQAEADLEVARAGVAEAESALEIAQRSFDRIELLRERGVSSEAQLDSVRAEQLSSEARLAVTRAQLSRAEASLETARIRQQYTRVTADWSGGGDERVVARRWVDEGETVSANDPLLSIVELDPLTGVFHVPERDYARLSPGQPVTVRTQAWPGREFSGVVARIAPVFRESTRQARVELSVPNPDLELKPGMFVRVTVELDRIDDATIVPEAALTERGDQAGVFVVAEDGATVRWCPVTVGIVEDGRAEVRGEGLEGRVVTLGQQLVEDGSAIVIPDLDARGSPE